ncbi:hypothetical protein Pth03_46020 [Planotetraspora thailandica]|uniref:Uncharacterized protein n=1 Tax=Planotetraspora thailandica TaxID=487172 RepID=A0A8J3V3Q4_9ACTN|nr:hypothetical protein Pth03_46020 [Planotetraspora thailandica]
MPVKVIKTRSSTSGGTVRSKSENFLGIVATTNKNKLRKKLQNVDTFVNHAKQRAFSHPALTKRPTATGAHA